MRIEVRLVEAGSLLVKLEGPLDRDTVPDIRGQLLRYGKKKGVRDVEIDLASVISVDTAGLAVLVELLIAVSRRGHVVRIRNSDANIERMLRLACVDKLFEMQSVSKSGT